ncbi:transposase [Candidatus Saccharibacteria bacterium]|nr:transposase [Candidatus Saccharibacteria bacterium]
MRVEPSIIIKTLKANNGAIRKTARDLGISPGTVINWRTIANRTSNSMRNTSQEVKLRYLKEKIFRKSTRPKTIKTGNTITRQDKKAIIDLRKEKGYGAEKIAYTLNLDVTGRTVHNFLKSEGLVKSKNYRRPRYQETAHMYVKNVDRPGKLQLDVKYVTPELSGLVHTTYLYALIDIYSRYKAGVILPALDQALTIEVLRYLLPGLPKQIKDNLDFIQTDNGLEYQQRFLNFLEIAHQELRLPNKISHHYIHKSSPNENAVIERSFRTDEEEFFWRIERPEDLTELNVMYQTWMEEYNTFRPHLGLDCMTPMEKLLSYNSI